MLKLHSFISVNLRQSSVTINTVWISYDLGIRGDYEGLYAWLDSHRAKECGDARGAQ